MKNFITFCLTLLLIYPLTQANDYFMNTGDPGIQSIHAITFSPEGVLFIGDSKNAAVFAIQTMDEPSAKVEDLSIENIDQLIASSLGVDVGKIVIQDMAIHPLSKAVYLAVHSVDGTPVLLRHYQGKLEVIDLSDVEFSKAKIQNAVEADAEDQRGRDLRVWAVSDLHFNNGHVMVSGLSNQEFSSSFTRIKYPFTDQQVQSSLEIFHAAHGRYETYAPIKTFTTIELNGEEHLIASYTCTPLVIFPMSELKDQQHTKGKTVAELGNRNTPLDMVTVSQDGEDYLLMSNTSRALMKVKLSDVASYSNYLTNPVEENSATAGVDFISLPMVNVQQMAKLDNERFVIIQRKANGNLDLNTHSFNRYL